MTTPNNKEQWNIFIEKLGLEQIGPKTWLANTPDGRRETTGTFINGIPSIYYRSPEGKIIATHVLTLNRKLITRSPNVGDKKKW